MALTKHRDRRARLSMTVMAAAVILVATAAQATQPNDSFRCTFVDPVYNIPRVWGFMAVFNFDKTVVRPAVIDIGILNDGETAPGGEQCDVTHNPGQSNPASFTCNAPVDGAYTGILPNRTEHGTNMKNIMAATLNDGGLAGIAGQVAVPHLYRFDEVHNYVFEMDATIDRAVSSGATSINISGGFPCAWNPLFFGGGTLDICTISGRLAAMTPLCAVPAPVPGLFEAQTVLCTGSLASVVAEGDIRARIGEAVTRARIAGVPIVASAGNVLEDDLVSILTGATAGNADTLDWRILPATLPGVITAGSVDPNPPYGNFDFHGPDVDIWAPSNDTSPAAAFVSGLIALAQAIDPELNPTTAQMPSMIYDRIRTALVESAYSNEELVAAGHLDPSGLRGNLVNPYRFIRTVAEGIVPDFESLGYSDHFDTWVAPSLSGQDGRPSDCNSVQVVNDAPDDEASAWEILVVVGSQQEIGGAIVYYPGEPAVVDEDWYKLSYAGLSPQGLHITELELRTLAGFGELVLASPDDLIQLDEIFLDGPEQVRRYRTRPMLGGAELPFRVAGMTAQDDNLYRLIVRQAPPVLVDPDPYDVAGPNDTPAQATLLAPGTIIPGLTIAETGILIEANGANFHTISDRDHYVVQGFAFPQGDIVQGVEHRVIASSHNVDVYLSTPSGGFIASGRGSVEKVLPSSGPFRIEVRSRYPGLFTAYDLSIRVKRQRLEPEGPTSRAGAAAELANFLYLMATRISPDDLPIEFGCVACNTLGVRGTIKRDRATIRPTEVTRFISLRTRSELVFSNVRRDAVIQVLDSDLRPTRGTVRRDGLVFDLPPGPYAVSWKPGSQEREIGYAVLPHHGD